MVRRLLRLAIFTAVILLAAASPLPGIIIDGFSLPRLIKDADVIAIGQIVVVSSATGRLVLSSHSLDVIEHSGSLLVDQVLKPGNFDGVNLPLRWITSRSNTLSQIDLYEDVKDGSYRVFFLKKDASGAGYGFVSPYYPGLPALRGVPLKGGDLESQIVDQVCAFLESNEGDPGVKTRVLSELAGGFDHGNNREYVSTLEKLANGADPHVRVAALYSLLLEKRVDFLPAARAEILQNARHAESWERDNLVIALAHHFDASQSMPILTEALRSSESNLREAAANALAATGSMDAVKPLFSVLNDQDSQLQWTAMQSLGALLHQPEWQPKLGDPADLQRCLAHWRQAALDWSPSPN